jgi:hypothetical protein
MIGSLLGKTEESSTSVPEALVAALGSHEGVSEALSRNLNPPD